MIVERRSIDASPDNYQSGTNEILEIIYVPAGQGIRHVISGVAWSFDAAQMGGSTLTIMDDARAVFSVDVTDGTYRTLYFDPPLRGRANAEMIVALDAGGVGVVGKLNVLGHWVESG